jgi:hypothetical protein
MNEQEQVNHFLKKVNERLTFLYQYYLPLGKEIPDSDRDLLFELYKIYDNGKLDQLCREPMEEQLVSQGALFSLLQMTTTTPK